MSYSVVQGDLKPMSLTLTEDDAPLVLQNGDAVTLRYTQSDRTIREVALAITNAAGGVVQANWSAGDTDVPGICEGQVTVARTGDPTFPRTFPDDDVGSVITWPVWRRI